MYQKDYLTLFNDIILDEKIKYATPVYSLEFIKASDNIQFTIAVDMFLETLLLRVRGETVKFLSFQKSTKCNLEKRLNKIH